MPFEEKLMHINSPRTTQYSDISILSFLSGTFLEPISGNFRYLHFYTSHLRGEGRHGVNGHLVVGDGDVARGGHVEGAGFCSETRVLASVFVRAAYEPSAMFS